MLKSLCFVHLPQNLHTLLLVSWLHGPQFLHRLDNANVIVDAVEETAKSGNGNKQQDAMGNFRCNIADNAGTHIIGDHGLNAPSDRKLTS